MEKFELFWAAWPKSFRKGGKSACLAKWKKYYCETCADQIRLYAKHEGRIHYVIHLGMIASPIMNYKWRRYRGYNPHNHHIHISFRKDQDNNSEFFNIPLLGGTNEQ